MFYSLWKYFLKEPLNVQLCKNLAFISGHFCWFDFNLSVHFHGVYLYWIIIIIKCFYVASFITECFDQQAKAGNSVRHYSVFLLGLKKSIFFQLGLKYVRSFYASVVTFFCFVLPHTSPVQERLRQRNLLRLWESVNLTSVGFNNQNSVD